MQTLSNGKFVKCKIDFYYRGKHLGDFECPERSDDKMRNEVARANGIGAYDFFILDINRVCGYVNKGKYITGIMNPEYQKPPDPGKPINKNMKSWKDLCGSGKTVKSFSTILTDDKGGQKLYMFGPKKNEVYVPFCEDMQGYLIGYVIAYNNTTNEEIFRKNIMNIDLLEWNDK